MGSTGKAGQYRGALLIGLGTSLAPLDTAVNVALPAMTGSFEMALGGAQWIVIA